MRLTPVLLLMLALLAGLVLWQAGLIGALGWWAAEQQRALQTALAGEIGALRAGRPGALAALVAACAGYGAAHAVGPGHGKALVGGAAFGTGAGAGRLAAIALAGSLGQAAVAIAAVYGGLLVFEATARGAVEGAEAWLSGAGDIALAAIGGWLLWRGIRAMRRPAHGCGHRHGPSPEEAARAAGFWPSLALVGAIAARPCSGALFVLVLAWRYDLAAAGALAVLAMGLGTALVTVLVAVGAVAGRNAALFGAGSGRIGRVAAPAMQIGAGAAMLLLGGALLFGASA